MSDENKENSTLNQLKSFNEMDNFTSVSFEEPELKEFSTANIFEIEKPAPARKKFGKRSDRKASQVKIKNYNEDMPDFTDKEPVVENTRIMPVNSDNAHEHVEIEPVQDEDLSITQTARLDASDLSKALLSEEGESTLHMEPVEVSAVTPAVEETISVSSAQEMPIDEPVIPFAPSLAPAVKSADDLDADVMRETIEEIFEQTPTFNLSEEESHPENEKYLHVDEDEDDIYMDKKHYNMANYPKIEGYLADQSSNGYHFVRQDGKKYYYVKGTPENYYYAYTYFSKEPDARTLAKLEKDGWKEVSRMEGLRRKDAGWIVYRNYQAAGEERKEIDNDEEKLRFFKKQASSYRSTMFLIFICMVCCAITAWLQFALYNGFWEILAACGILFIICLIALLTYARYLGGARKRVKLLKSRIRKKKKELEANPVAQSEQELESEWQAMPEETGKKKKKKKAKKMQ